MRLCIYVSIKHLENELAIGNTSVMIDCVLIRYTFTGAMQGRCGAGGVCTGTQGIALTAPYRLIQETLRARIRKL